MFLFFVWRESDFLFRVEWSLGEVVLGRALYLGASNVYPSGGVYVYGKNNGLTGSGAFLEGPA